MSARHDMQTDAGQVGFTLVELVVTVVIAGVVLLSLLIGFHEALRQMAMQRDVRTAVALGEDLMCEVRSKQFVNQFTPFILARADCVCVDDYHMWSESPPQTVEGAAMSNFAGFARMVVVQNIEPVGFDFNGPSTTNVTDFKRITVVVSNSHAVISNVSVVTAD